VDEAGKLSLFCVNFNFSEQALPGFNLFIFLLSFLAHFCDSRRSSLQISRWYNGQFFLYAFANG
jgi:hypothetical protein